MASTASREQWERTAYVRRIVVEYLRKHGYKSAEKELIAEAGAEADATFDDESRNAVMILDRATEGYEDQPLVFEDMYKELRAFAHGSLDMYKGELLGVLYPHLVHCFLEMVRRGASQIASRFLHKYGEEFMKSSPTCARELRSLSGVTTPQLIAENETAKLFLNNRYELSLSAYALELLLAFLTDNPRRYLLLRILNHKCRVIDQTLPAVGSGVDDRRGFFASQEQSSLVATKDVLWGTLKEKDFMLPDENKEKEGEEATAAAAAAAATAAGAKKEDAEEEEDEKKPPHVEADGTLSESPVPIPKFRLGAPGLETFGLNKNRALLSRTNLPSCLFYTFANTRGCAMNCVSMSPDASIVVAGFQESSIRAWDYKSGSLNGIKLVGHSGPVFSVDLSFSGRYILSGSEDGTVRLWSLPLRADLVAYRGHNHPVWSVAWGPLGYYFASGSHDSTARIWSTDRISPLRVLSGHLSDVDAVKWHPNCNYVATGSSDLTSRLWDIRTGECVRVFGRHPGALQALAFSPNGRYLAMAGHTKDIHIWDIAEGKQVQNLTGHKGSVWDLAYSCDGTFLASASSDNTVRVWDPKVADVSRVTATGVAGAVPGQSGPGAGTTAAAAGARARPIATAAAAAAGKTGKGTDGSAPTTAPAGSAAAPAASAAAPAAPPTSGSAPVATAATPTPSPSQAQATQAAMSAATRASSASKDESPLLVTFRTKRTPVYYVNFTRKNLLIAAGAYGC